MNLSRVIPVKEVIFGVHIYLHPSGSQTVTCVKMQKTGNELKPLMICDSVSGIDSLIKHIPSGSTVCLSINGKGIIHKRFKASETDKDALLNLILPNADKKEFYLQHCESGDEYVFASVLRKEILDHLLAAFQKQNYLTVIAIPGPFSFITLSSLFQFPQYLKLNNYLIEFKQNYIEAIFPDNNNENITNPTFRFMDDSFTAEQLLCCSNVLLHITQPVSFTSISNDLITRNREDSTYKRSFKKIGTVALAMFLILLTVNFMVFDSYSKKYNRMNAKYSEHILTGQLMDSLDRSIKEKEQFIQENGILSHSEFSYRIDRLMIVMPQSILLNSLAANPVLKRVKKENEIQYDKSKITIKGIVQSTTDLGLWIQMIKKEKWIKELRIADYKFDDRKQTGFFELELITD
jgi:hypothetical protein